MSTSSDLVPPWVHFPPISLTDRDPREFSVRHTSSSTTMANAGAVSKALTTVLLALLVPAALGRKCSSKRANAPTCASPTYGALTLQTTHLLAALGPCSRNTEFTIQGDNTVSGSVGAYTFSVERSAGSANDSTTVAFSTTGLTASDDTTGVPSQSTGQACQALTGQRKVSPLTAGALVTAALTAALTAPPPPFPCRRNAVNAASTKPEHRLCQRCRGLHLRRAVVPGNLQRQSRQG